MVLLWAPLHNTVFDRIDWRRTGRTASARGSVGRLLHAITLESTVLLVTCPLVMWLGGHTLRAALTVNVSPTLFYVGYAYVSFTCCSTGCARCAAEPDSCACAGSLGTLNGME